MSTTVGPIFPGIANDHWAWLRETAPDTHLSSGAVIGSVGFSGSDLELPFFYVDMPTVLGVPAGRTVEDFTLGINIADIQVGKSLTFEVRELTDRSGVDMNACTWNDKAASTAWSPASAGQFTATGAAAFTWSAGTPGGLQNLNSAALTALANRASTLYSGIFAFALVPTVGLQTVNYYSPAFASPIVRPSFTVTFADAPVGELIGCGPAARSPGGFEAAVRLPGGFGSAYRVSGGAQPALRVPGGFQPAHRSPGGSQPGVLTTR